MAAGDSVTIAKPWFYRGEVYPTPTVFPAIDLDYRAAWPTGWVRERGFQNGVTLTLQKPVVAITTSDLGIVAYIPGEAHGVQMSAQFRLPTASLIKRLASFYEVAATAPDAEVWSFDPTDELGTYPSSEFRVGIEGRAQAGGLFSTPRTIRILGFRAQQGGNTAIKLDHSGNDAGIFPTMTVQLLPYTVTSGEVTGTGLDLADIRSDKMVWLNCEDAA